MKKRLLTQKWRRGGGGDKKVESAALVGFLGGRKAGSDNLYTLAEFLGRGGKHDV